MQHHLTSGGAIVIDQWPHNNAPVRYTGICIGGPLHDTELTSTEKTHRISVPEGKTIEGSPGHYTRFFRQMEYHFRNGQWEYQG